MAMSKGEFDQETPTLRVHPHECRCIKGELDQDPPTLVRVHTVSSVRDLLAVSLAERASWSIQDSLSRVGLEGGGVVVLINQQESDA